MALSNHPLLVPEAEAAGSASERRERSLRQYQRRAAAEGQEGRPPGRWRSSPWSFECRQTRLVGGVATCALSWTVQGVGELERPELENGLP